MNWHLIWNFKKPGVAYEKEDKENSGIHIGSGGDGWSGSVCQWIVEVKRLMDAGGVSFHVIDLVLEYPKPTDDSPRREGRVETMEFLYADIYEEGMVERVAAANEAAIAHHAKVDAESEKITGGMKEK